MKSIRAAIFDVDGTLVDSVDIHAQAWRDAFGDFGYEIPLAEIRGQIGKGGDQLMPVFLNEKDLETKSEALEKHRTRILHDRYLRSVRPFPKVRELFEALRGRGIDVALASSAKQDELEFYKKTADIADLVGAETSTDDAERSKPHPDIFQAALRRLPGAEPGSIVVIGDTPYDAEAARKIDLRCIGVACSGWPAVDLKKAGCASVYRDPADLLANIERWTALPA